MAEPYIWSNLARANNDNTTIDEAIAEAVATHEADPDAHLGADEALQSHRAAEIIDHAAESVVNDKLKANARTYLAIVDNNSDADYDTVEDAVDFAHSRGGGSIFVRAGTYTPARPLRVRAGVDIYGEGVNETHVDCSALSGIPLNFDGNVTPEPIELPYFYWYENSDVADVDLPTGVDIDELTGCYIELPWGDGEIYGNDGNGAVYLWDVAPEDGDGEPSIFNPTVVASTTSPYVYVNCWAILSDLANGEGLAVETTQHSLGYFESYDDAGTITLTANSSVTTDTDTGIFYYSSGGRMSVLQSISFEVNDSYAIFRVNNEKARVMVRDCDFTNVKTLLWRNSSTLQEDGKGLDVTYCRFYFGAYAADMGTAGANFHNCEFRLRDATTNTELGGEGTLFENCNFTGKITASTNYAPYIRQTTRFNECTFINFLVGNVCNSGYYTGSLPYNNTRFISCELINSSAANITFVGTKILVEGCFVRLATGSTIGTASGYKYNSIVGCYGQATAGTQYASCLIANNNFTSSMT